MGVRGLTTFIANRSHLYLEKYQLHDCYLVLDGNSVCCQLYVKWAKCNDCFGGDYDQYAQIVYKFFNLLKACNVTPLVIFDGGYERRKLRTIYARIRKKINNAQKINGVNQGYINLFPLLMWEVFGDVLHNLRVKCVRCDFEGDCEIAAIARNLQCPVLSYDSDFYIFNVLYIPFVTLDLRVVKGKDFSYIPCQIYRVENFLNNFGGLSKDHLPLLAVMLGNDYVKSWVFTVFYQNLHIKNVRNQQTQQTRIKQVILWLQNESVQDAIRKILGRFKLRHRARLARVIEKSFENYSTTQSELFAYLRIKPRETRIVSLKMPNWRDLEEPDYEPEILEPGSDSESPKERENKDEEEEESRGEEEKKEGNDKEKEEDNEDDNEEQEDEGTEENLEQEKANNLGFIRNLPKFFIENHRKAVFPACFIDIIYSRVYYNIQQVENFSEPQSHSISSKLISTLGQILNLNPSRDLKVYGRNEQGQIEKNWAQKCPFPVPTIFELDKLNAAETRKILMKTLEINVDFIKEFPSNWLLFLISLKYWITNSVKTVEISMIYSIILCAIILSKLDKIVGFTRNAREISGKFNRLKNKPELKYSVDVRSSLNNISYSECVICLKNLLTYFTISEKCRSRAAAFKRQTVHSLAEFQSCLLHLKYLNKLLHFPVDDVLIWEFYNGTFIYNMTENLHQRNLDSYLKLLLEGCPNVLNSLQMIVNKITNEDIRVVKTAPKKRKKKKKNNKTEADNEEIVVANSDAEGYNDVNNKFSMLSI